MLGYLLLTILVPVCFGSTLAPMPMMPAEFGKFIIDETERAKMIRAANVKPE